MGPRITEFEFSDEAPQFRFLICRDVASGSYLLGRFTSVRPPCTNEPRILYFDSRTPIFRCLDPYSQPIFIITNKKLPTPKLVSKANRLFLSYSWANTAPFSGVGLLTYVLTAAVYSRLSMKGGTRNAMKAASASVIASRTGAWPTIFILHHFRVVECPSVNRGELRS